MITSLQLWVIRTSNSNGFLQNMYRNVVCCSPERVLWFAQTYCSTSRHHVVMILHQTMICSHFFYSTWVIGNDTNADSKLQLEYAYYLKDTDVHMWSLACGTSIRMLYKCSSGTIQQQSNACAVSEDSFTLRKEIVLLTIRLRLLLLKANATEGSSSK